MTDVELQQHNLPAARSLIEEALLTLNELGDRWFMALSLEAFGAVAAAAGQAEHAVCFFGAAEALREAIQCPMPPSRQALYRRHLAAARTQLDTNSFTRAWTKGRNLTPQQALALMPPPPSTPADPTAPLLPNALTNREADVLRALAAGLTNAQIAEHLIVSPTTINAHLRKIYGKLDVTSRTAAVRFAVEHGLV